MTSSAAHSAFASLSARGGPALWVVSSGGHLLQATIIERIIGVHPNSVWITNDVPQARSLLDGRRAHFVPYVAPRDLRGALRTATLALEIAAQFQPTQAISTGAAIAGIALPRLALSGLPSTFVESVARKTKHSLTGRIARAAPGVRTLTQYADNATAEWSYEGSILSSWSAAKTTPQGIDRPLRIFVTLGTIKPYRFDRAVDAVLKIVEVDDEIVWQVGETRRSHLPGRAHESLSNARIQELLEWADVVVTHAGVGSIVDSLEVGKVPVLATRRMAHSEHVDDHQLDIVGEITGRGLGYELDLASPTRSTLLAAAGTGVSKS